MAYSSSDDSDSDRVDECPEGIEFSKDEGLPPDKPVFTGLFRPSIFKSLLHKAKFTTKFGVTGSSLDKPAQSSKPHEALFQVTKPDPDVIPCPPLFKEVVQNAYGQPGSLTAPSGLDKKLNASASELDEILSLPTVDAPVASLSLSSLVSKDVGGWPQNEGQESRTWVQENTPGSVLGGTGCNGHIFFQ